MKYMYSERVGAYELPLVVTRTDVAKMACHSRMSAEEREAAIDAYIAQKGAVEFSDLSLRELQILVGAPSVHAVGVSDEERMRLRREIADMVRRGAALANALGESLSDIVERSNS